MRLSKKDRYLVAKTLLYDGEPPKPRPKWTDAELQVPPRDSPEWKPYMGAGSWRGKRARDLGLPPQLDAATRLRLQEIRDAVPSKVRKRLRRDYRRLLEERRRRRAFEGLAVEWAEILRADPCCYCGATGEAVDHISPLASRGDNDWDNLTSACTSCNSRKRDRGLLQFLLAYA